MSESSARHIIDAILSWLQEATSSLQHASASLSSVVPEGVPAHLPLIGVGAVIGGSLLVLGFSRNNNSSGSRSRHGWNSTRNVQTQGTRRTQSTYAAGSDEYEETLSDDSVDRALSFEQSQVEHADTSLSLSPPPRVPSADSAVQRHTEITSPVSAPVEPVVQPDRSPSLLPQSLPTTPARPQSAAELPAQPSPLIPTHSPARSNDISVPVETASPVHPRAHCAIPSSLRAHHREQPPTTRRRSAVDHFRPLTFNPAGESWDHTRIPYDVLTLPDTRSQPSSSGRRQSHNMNLLVTVLAVVCACIIMLDSRLSVTVMPILALGIRAMLESVAVAPSVFITEETSDAVRPPRKSKRRRNPRPQTPSPQPSKPIASAGDMEIVEDKLFVASASTSPRVSTPPVDEHKGVPEMKTIELPPPEVIADDANSTVSSRFSGLNSSMISQTSAAGDNAFEEAQAEAEAENLRQEAERKRLMALRDSDFFESVIVSNRDLDETPAHAEEQQYEIPHRWEDVVKAFTQQSSAPAAEEKKGDDGLFSFWGRGTDSPGQSATQITYRIREQHVDDSTHTRYITRDLTVPTTIPLFIRKLLSAAGSNKDHVLIKEKCKIDSHNRVAFFASVNDTFSSYVVTNETRSIQPSPLNPNHTVLTQSGTIYATAYCGMLRGTVRDWALKEFRSGSKANIHHVLDSIQ